MIDANSDRSNGLTVQSVSVMIVSGELQSFGYDAATGQVVVRFDGALSTAGGTRVETRRFEANAPSDGTAQTIGPALNRAANEVSLDVANWIGSRQAP